MDAVVADLMREAFRAWRPPDKLSLSEWSDRFAKLSAESAAVPGDWQTLPYQKGIMDAITDDALERVVVIKSARVGYTKIVNNLIGYHIHQDPCPMMVVQPTLDDARGYSNEEIAPMLRDTPVLRGLVAESKAKDTSSTILQKSFPGGTLGLVGANSARGFRRVSRRVVIFDEVDGYPLSAGDEGDPVRLGIRRSEYYWNRKIVMGSTPTIKGVSRIEENFEQTDQRRFFVPCPHCGEYQYLKWGGPDKPYGFKWENDDPATTYYLCEASACVIEEADKRAMIEAGEWRATAKEKSNPRYAGFHIWAAYSYSPNATWSTIVDEFLQARGDSLSLRTWVNTVLGETWEEQGQGVDAHFLVTRAEHEDYERETVPSGVAVLVAAVDVQGDRLEAKIIGYGAGEESWLIDYQVFYGDPEATKEDEISPWQQLDAWRMKTWTRDDGVNMLIALLLVDARDGNRTKAIYDYVQPRQAQRVFAQMGRERLSHPGLAVESTTKRSHIKLWLTATMAAKDRIFSRMLLSRPGPGYMHMPHWLPSHYFDQMTAEKKIITQDKRTKRRKETYVKSGRNEALDLEAYCLAGLFILQNFIAPGVYRDLDRLLQVIAGNQPVNAAARGRRVRSRGMQ